MTPQKLFKEKFDLERDIEEFKKGVLDMFQALKYEVVNSETDEQGRGLVKTSKLWSSDSQLKKMQDYYEIPSFRANMLDSCVTYFYKS